MCYDHLRVGPQARLDTSRLPLPEHHVAFAISAADPLPVRREADLTRIARNGVPGEALVAGLTEVIGTIYQDLVIQTLRSEVFLYMDRRTSALAP